MLRLAGNETENTTTIIYRDKPVYYNFTEEEVSTIDDRLVSLEGKGDRTYNLYKQESDKVKQDIESIKGDSQEIRDYVNENLEKMRILAEKNTNATDLMAKQLAEKEKEEKRAKRIKTIWNWIKWIIVTLAAIGLGIAFFIIKIKKDKIRDVG